MKITARESARLKASLPSDYIKQIQAQLKEKGVNLSRNWVGYVVSGKQADNYGIIDIAISIAQKQKEQAKNKKKLINSL